ncbi:MAG: gliding motility-associated C-terminal domain-containing protein [Chitinophagales bacterium]|nr:gliding motility-associated C-terminal domain-containing protein [Chitinophagales bacterium]MDW8417849.1 gliding motility-associated C-terminal domain-containing protein [Chitinophagales bacterium]
MKKIHTLFLLAFVLIGGLLPIRLNASHIMGSDITYRCLGGNNYQVVVTIYRDCSGISMPTSITVTVNSNCGTQNITCPLDQANSGFEVSQLCPTAVSTCLGGSLPGVQVYTYVGNYTIQPGCGPYTFSYDDCCRNPSNNIVNPTSQGFMVRATLDTNVPCNSAPEFTSLPVPYFCINQPVNYSHGAVDADGDSLVYTLIPPLDDLGNNIPFTGGYSATNPMPTAGGFNFDPQTGQMTFTPTAQGVYVVDVLVQEYRNGVLIGSTMRDIQIVIINCTNNAPSVQNCLTPQNSSGGVIIDCNSLGVCPGQTVTFTLFAFDPNGQNITVSSNLAQSIPGASLTVSPVGTGNDSVQAVFTWVPTATDTGFRYFTIQFEDDACPITGLQLFTYDITVLPGTYAGPDLYYCTGGGPVTITAKGGNQFSWTPTSYIVSVSGPDSSSITVAPPVTTTYIVQSDLQGSCKNRDTVIVYNVVSHQVSVTATEDTVCLNENSVLTAIGSPAAQGPYTFQWASGPSGNIQSPTQGTTTVSPTSTTTYYVTVTSANGCPVKDSIKIVVQGVGPKVKINPSANYVCPGDAVTLQTQVSAVDCGPVPDPQNPCLPNSTFALQDLGTGTGSAGANTTPYVGFWMDGRVQYLYRASELQALGLGAGAITDIGFNVITKNSTQPYNEFTIKMGCTNLNALPSNFVSGLTQVLNPVSYSTTLGWNTHTLDVPFNWDGFSNLIIEVCFNNNSYTQYDNVAFTPTSFTNSVLWDNADLSTASGCTALTTPVLGQNRPNTRFVMCIAPLTNYTFNWSASNNTPVAPVASPTVNVVSNTIYSVTVDDGTCQGNANVTVLVDTAVLISAGNDTIKCGDDTVLLSGKVLFPATQVCVPSYTITSIPYSPLNPLSPPAAGPAGDDVVSSAITLPFNFQFFCNNYSQFFISTNGWISFTGGQGSGFTAQSIPNPASPNNLIAMCWEDLLSPSGVITHYVVGTAPNRRYVIRWNNASFFGASGNVSGQIQLHETTNIIEVHIASQTSANQTATLGVENSNGTVGHAPVGYNQSGWTVPASSPVAFRFTPNVAGNVLTSVQWSPTTGLSSPTTLNTLAYPSTTTDYVLAATFSNGCVTYDTVRVSIGNVQYALSVQPDSICKGATSQLTVTGNATVFNWTPANSLNASNISNPVASPSITTTYYVTMFDSIGCRADDSIRVVVRTHPPITLGPDQTVCPYDSVTLTPSGGPYVSYLWSTGATTPSITTGAQTQPTQDYWVTINDGYCFYNSDTVTIAEYILNPIVTNPSGDTTICIGESITLYAAPGYASYLWTNGAQTQTITVNTAGVYSYTATDANGCQIKAIDTAFVSVKQKPDATITVSDDTICAGQTTATLSVNPVSGIIYTWAPGNITASSITVSSAGTYSLTADDNGCKNTSSVQISETTPPSFTLGADQNHCSCDTTITLSPNVAGSYNWSNGQTSPSINITSTGTYAVTVTDANQCTGSSSVNIEIRCLTVDAIVADPPSGTIFTGKNAGLKANTSYTSSFTYVWSPSTYLNDTTIQTPIATAVQNTTTYFVTVVDNEFGCIASDSIQVKVVPPGIPPMPNAFTPNGDGNNDSFGPYIPPQLQGVYTLVEMRIYNRWGQLVYNGNGYWDGTFNGAMQPAETYIYYVTLQGPDQNNPGTNIQYNLFGSVTLIH